MEISSTAAIFTLINMVLIIAFVFIVVYSFVLFVKLALRGIKALDIYIEEKTRNK